MLNIFTINFNENLDIIFMHGESKGEISKLIKKKKNRNSQKMTKNCQKWLKYMSFEIGRSLLLFIILHFGCVHMGLTTLIWKDWINLLSL